MSHVKMHIDENTFSAKEYAYMVRHIDDIDAMIRSTSKEIDMYYRCELLIGGMTYDATNELVNWDDVEMSFKRGL